MNINPTYENNSWYNHIIQTLSKIMFLYFAVDLDRNVYLFLSAQRKIKENVKNAVLRRVNLK